MKTERDQDLRRALRQAASLPDPRPAAAFWQDFRVRAEQTAQVDPEAEAEHDSALLSLRWVLAAAAVLVLLGLAAVYLHPWSSPQQIATAGPGPLSRVEEVEVLAEYSSVMIVEDRENGGTLIWVASAGAPAGP